MCVNNVSCLLLVRARFHPNGPLYFVGWFEPSPPNKSLKKVGQVGQVPCFVGFVAGSKLANLADFSESGVIFGRWRFHSICLFIRRMRRVIETHRVIEKKLAKLVKFPVS